MYAASCDTFEQATRAFVQSTSMWELMVNIGKTKGLVVGRYVEESDVGEVQLEGGAVKWLKILPTWVVTSQELGRSERRW